MTRTSATRPLQENTGLAFAGARVRAGLIVGAAAAQRILVARNRHGKPNADVLRPYVVAEDFQFPQESDIGAAAPVARPLRGRVIYPPALGDRGLPRAALRDDQLGFAGPGRDVRDGATSDRWVVDFPADTTPEEASLYAEPWRRFAKAGGVLRARADPMRIAIARLESFLVAPLGRAVHGFARIDSATLPGAELCVVATDDDFIAAVLQSGMFATWVAAHGGRLRVHHVASFPFPWAPRTGRSGLTRAQLEFRDNVLRASAADLDAAVTAAYGWSDIDDDHDLAARLQASHARHQTGVRT